MPQTAVLEPETHPTEHPHVVRTEGVCGGRPRIRGSRISVRTVAALHIEGESAQEIAATYPQVGLAAVHDAISYYLDHRDEIDSEIDDNRLDNVLDTHGAILGDDGVIRFESS